MLNNLITSGEKGIGFPAVTGKAASKAGKSTSKTERTPSQPATHKIANSLVLALIISVKFSSVKIEFSLTVDQYAEWWNLDRQKRESMAPLFIICIGVLLVLVGYVIAQSTTDSGESRGPMIFAVERALALGGLLILTLGLILPFVAILLWFYQARPRPKDKKELQSTFERFHAGPRTFQANDSTWQFSFEGSQDTKVWGSLARIVKTHDLFIMQDAYQSYALPRAVMTAEQHSTLEDLCKRTLLPSERLFYVPMIASPRDYVTAMMRNDWWQRPWKSLAWTSGGLFCLWLFTYVIADAWPAVGHSMFIPITLVLPLMHGFYHYQGFQRYRVRAFHAAEITEDRICFTIGSLYDLRECRVLRYNWLYKVRESRRMMFLYLGPSHAFALPKAGFEPQQLARFRQLLKMPA